MRQNYLKSHFRDQSFFPVATFLFKVKFKKKKEKKKKKVDFEHVFVAGKMLWLLLLLFLQSCMPGQIYSNEK